MTVRDRPLSIVVIGASGDLARQKILPALFALHCQKLLPATWRIYGFARSPYDDAAFRQAVERHLTCRYVPEASCADRMREFLERCHYVQGAYASPDAYLDLYERMRATQSLPAHTLFYLAVPSSLFGDIGQAMGAAGMVACGPQARAWTRVVVEKPFGRDRATSDALMRRIDQVFTEDQIFRIDHYLGKEVVQNLLVLRFANLVFEPFWSRLFVRDVRIEWAEDLSIAGRGSYFDNYGIIRDVMQNHLLQILALLAMERPAELTGDCIRDEKARVLRLVPPVAPEHALLGQYTAGRSGTRAVAGYLEEDGVAADSRTPTYAAVMLQVPNRRWQGVPFLMTAGKGLGERTTRIRVRFKEVPSGLFHTQTTTLGTNELVLRVQPDEALFLRLFHKVPGLEMKLAASDLNLRYQEAFQGTIPEAYERLLLDVLQGEQSLFIRKDELQASWDIFTPLLQAAEARDSRPQPYAFGSHGPKGLRSMALRHGLDVDE